MDSGAGLCVCVGFKELGGGTWITPSIINIYLTIWNKFHNFQHIEIVTYNVSVMKAINKHFTELIKEKSFVLRSVLTSSVPIKYENML